VSVSTINRALRRRGKRRQVARVVPALTQVHKARRLSWTLEHVSWTHGNWSRVVFTDEKTLQSCEHGHPYVWREKNQRLDPDLMVEEPGRRFELNLFG